MRMDSVLIGPLSHHVKALLSGKSSKYPKPDSLLQYLHDSHFSA